MPAVRVHAHTCDSFFYNRPVRVCVYRESPIAEQFDHVQPYLYNTERRRINELFLEARFFRRRILLPFASGSPPVRLHVRNGRSSEAAWHVEKFIRGVFLLALPAGCIKRVKNSGPRRSETTTIGATRETARKQRSRVQNRDAQVTLWKFCTTILRFVSLPQETPEVALDGSFSSYSLSDDF